jgi:hypothetical protein
MHNMRNHVSCQRDCIKNVRSFQEEYGSLRAELKAEDDNDETCGLYTLWNC